MDNLSNQELITIIKTYISKDEEEKNKQKIKQEKEIKNNYTLDFSNHYIDDIDDINDIDEIDYFNDNYLINDFTYSYTYNYTYKYSKKIDDIKRDDIKKDNNTDKKSIHIII
jgi:hypothetical protein